MKKVYQVIRESGYIGEASTVCGTYNNEELAKIVKIACDNADALAVFNVLEIEVKSL